MKMGRDTETQLIEEAKNIANALFVEGAASGADNIGQVFVDISEGIMRLNKSLVLRDEAGDTTIAESLASMARSQERIANRLEAITKLLDFATDQL
jgi:hypothetical protein